MSQILDSDGSALLSTGIIVRGPGTRPYRVVLRHLQGNEVTPFVTHVEVMDKVETFTPSRAERYTETYAHRGYEVGHYFATFAEAMDDFVERVTPL